jgi:hypothetical protein
MRTIARGNTPENCQKRVDALKKGGWESITDVIRDPSPSISESFVCVMEIKDTPFNKNNEKKRFNHGHYGF